MPLPSLHRTQLPAPVTGSPLRWARDFGIAGGLQMGTLLACDAGTGFSTPMLAFIGAGALLAALLGLALPALLERSRGLIPFRLLWPGALLLSAAWGSLSLYLGFSMLRVGGVITLISIPQVVWTGSFVGVSLFGGFWFAYTVLSVLKQRTWPLLALTIPWSILVYGILSLFL